MAPQSGVVSPRGHNVQHPFAMSANGNQFIATLENRQGLKVACPEEIAYRQQWIDAAQLEHLAQPLTKTGYGQYLLRVLKEQLRS